MRASSARKTMKKGRRSRWVGVYTDWYDTNPKHPDASRLIVGDPEPLEWDARLFGIPSPI
jgi:hypothetical protein